MLLLEFDRDQVAEALVRTNGIRSRPRVWCRNGLSASSVLSLGVFFATTPALVRPVA